MGKRGKNRTGYYNALLYTLELHYGLELEHKGDNPSAWHPLARNRPDQFLKWVMNGLETLAVAPVTHEHAESLLRSIGLSHIAKVINHLTTGPTRKVFFDALPHEQYAASGSRPDKLVEAHPQVRKFALAVAPNIDNLWKEALITVEATFSDDSFPRAARVLGGLPPDFEVVNSLLFKGLRSFPCDEEIELSFIEFYGLAAGALPEAPEPWHIALKHLEKISIDDAAHIMKLSNKQASQLSSLGEQAISLIPLILKLARSNPEWRTMLTLMNSLAIEDLKQMLDLVHASSTSSGKHHKGGFRLSSSTVNPRVEYIVRHYRGGIPLEEIVSQLESDARHSIIKLIGIDEELFSKVSKHFRLDLLQQLQGWDKEIWRQVFELFDNHWIWVSEYLEDMRVLEAHRNLRTSAELHLRDLFPQSMSWLDKQLNDALEEISLSEMSGISTLAAAYSRAVKQEFFSQAKR